MYTNSALQLELDELKALAVETFGSESKADHWLNSTHTLLGITPISFAQKNNCINEIKKILSAINYGGVV